MANLGLCFLCLFLVLPTFVENSSSHEYLKREHSLNKPYQGTGTGIPYWDFLGHTLVTSEYVRLTANKQSQRGALWNMVPVTMVNWEVQIQFKVTGSTGSLFGDGFAFWYARDAMQEGDVFGNRDFFSGLAVMADTYSNHNGAHKHGHPYVSAVVNNGSVHYDHDSDGTHTQLGGCQCKFRNLKHDTALSIMYLHDTVTVRMRIDGSQTWQPCFEVEGVILPTGYFFGLSAATGDLSDNHDIVSFKAYDLLPLDGGVNTDGDRRLLQPSAQHFEPEREHSPDPEPTSVGAKLLYVLVGVVVICGAVIGGGLWWAGHKERQRKRFY